MHRTRGGFELEGEIGMKSRAVILVLVVVAGGLAVAGEKPVRPPIDFGAIQRIPCNMTTVNIDWDFAVSDQGFTTTTCDATGGASVWEYGTTSYVPGAPGTVWGTVLEGDYPVDAGEGLISPPFFVDGDHDVMEILAYVDAETEYDGGNVTVNDTVIPPIDDYPAIINSSPAYYAYCVDDEEGFTSHPATWEQQCFDLVGYLGQTIQVRFDFGSDRSVTDPGWYLAYVRIGDDFIPVELQRLTVE